MKGLIERCIGPGVRLMQNLRLSVKFAIVSAASLAPLCVAVYATFSNAHSNMTFAERQRLGADFIAPLNELVLALTTRAEDGAAARDALKELEDLNARHRDVLGIAGGLRLLRAALDGNAARAATLTRALALYGHVGNDPVAQSLREQVDALLAAVDLFRLDGGTEVDDAPQTRAVEAPQASTQRRHAA